MYIFVVLAVYSKETKRADPAISANNEHRSERLRQESLVCVERYFHNAKSQKVRPFIVTVLMKNR